MSTAPGLTFVYGRTLALSGLSYHPARRAHYSRPGFHFSLGGNSLGKLAFSIRYKAGDKLLWQAHTSMELLQRNHFDLMEYPSMELALETK